MAGLSYPDDLPVVAFVSQPSVDADQRWFAAHKSQLEQSNRSELVVLDGGHYRHWTRSPEMAAAIESFLG